MAAILNNLRIEVKTGAQSLHTTVGGSEYSGIVCTPEAYMT